jgi:hypothetical protein
MGLFTLIAFGVPSDALSIDWFFFIASGKEKKEKRIQNDVESIRESL